MQKSNDSNTTEVDSKSDKKVINLANEDRNIFGNCLYNASKVVNENIERIWLFIKDLEFLIKISNGLMFSDLSYIEGNNSYVIGNIIKITWVGVTSSFNKVIDVINNENIKSISWEVDALIGLNFIFTIKLNRLQNQTILKIIVSQNPLKKNDSVNTKDTYYNDLLKLIINDYEKYIKNSNDYKFTQVSCIINKPINYLISFFEDLKNLKKFTGINNLQDYENSFIKLKVEDKIIYFNKKSNTKVNKKCKKYEIAYEVIGSNPQIPRQKLICNFIKINKGNKTQISLLDLYTQKVNKEYMDKIYQIQYQALFKLKEYLNNNNIL